MSCVRWLGLPRRIYWTHLVFVTCAGTRRPNVPLMACQCDNRTYRPNGSCIKPRGSDGWRGAGKNGTRGKASNSLNTAMTRPIRLLEYFRPSPLGYVVHLIGFRAHRSSLVAV